MGVEQLGVLEDDDAAGGQAVDHGPRGRIVQRRQLVRRAVRGRPQEDVAAGQRCGGAGVRSVREHKEPAADMLKKVLHAGLAGVHQERPRHPVARIQHADLCDVCTTEGQQEGTRVLGSRGRWPDQTSLLVLELALMRVYRPSRVVDTSTKWRGSASAHTSVSLLPDGAPGRRR